MPLGHLGEGRTDSQIAMSVLLEPRGARTILYQEACVCGGMDASPVPEQPRVLTFKKTKPQAVHAEKLEVTSPQEEIRSPLVFPRHVLGNPHNRREATPPSFPLADTCVQQPQPHTLSKYYVKPQIFREDMVGLWPSPFESATFLSSPSSGAMGYQAW